MAGELSPQDVQRVTVADWEVVHGNCMVHMRTMPAASVDAIVCDPPYGLGFMGRGWDRMPPGVEWARECLRVLKPGGHLVAFGGTRTYHRLAVAVEDAGFEVRDMLAWMYGSGFPKSLDVGKAIDKAAGATREVVGKTRSGLSADGSHEGWKRPAHDRETYDVTAPATPEAVEWDGWGTALKPAHEPILLARKPLTGTVAGNVLEHGTGALNIDATRIGSGQDRASGGARPAERDDGWGMLDGGDRPTGGRWPANVVLDEDAAALLDEQTGELSPSPTGAVTGRQRSGGIMGSDGDRRVSMSGHGDRGGASRFFYVAKASSWERNAGLDGFQQGRIEVAALAPPGRARHGDRSARGKDLSSPRANTHPTVKPVALMRWLVRLVTPPGGLVLDPFAGSGTCGIACVLDGFRYLGVELDPDGDGFVDIARARIAHWAEHGDAALKVRAEPAETAEPAEPPPVPTLF